MTTRLPQIVHHEPMPEYMSRLLMRGARFVEGNTSEATQPEGKPATPTPADLHDKGDKGGDVPAGKANEPGDDEPLGESGKKALEREREARRDAEKRASDAEAKLRQHEDVGKTDLQKAQDAATAVQAELETTRQKLWLAEALVDYPVPEEHRHLIKGDTAEEVKAAAESISQLVNRPGVVKESGRSGDTSKTGSITELRRQIAASRTARI